MLCPECCSDNLSFLSEDENNKELICNNCGLLITEQELLLVSKRKKEKEEEEEIEIKPKKDEDRNRNTNINLDVNLNLKIKPSNKTEQRVLQGILKLEEISRKLQLDKEIKKKAAEVYKKAILKDLIKGRKNNVVISTCIYIAARKLGLNISLERICLEAGVGKRLLARNIRTFCRKLNIELKPTRIEEVLFSLSKSLSLSEEDLTKAYQIIQSAREQGINLNGKNRFGIAAAAIYLATEGGRGNNKIKNKHKHKNIITQRKLSIITGVTEITIKNRVRELRSCLSLSAYRQLLSGRASFPVSSACTK